MVHKSAPECSTSLPLGLLRDRPQHHGTLVGGACGGALATGTGREKPGKPVAQSPSNLRLWPPVGAVTILGGCLHALNDRRSIPMLWRTLIAASTCSPFARVRNPSLPVTSTDLFHAGQNEG